MKPLMSNMWSITALQPHHLEPRLVWACDYLLWDVSVRLSVVFIDDKKFSLDSPDDLEFF